MDFLPFPCFSSEKLAIWFAQVESVFSLNSVLTDSDKYDYVVAHIPTEFTSIIEDILLNPPQQSKYDHIKYEFIKRMSIYNLKREKLTTETPSEYLRRLIKIADQRVPIELVLNTWLKNLPKPVREVVSLETSGHVETIGPMADKVMALLSPETENYQSLSSEQYQTIVKRIDELTKQVKIVQYMLDEDYCFEEHQMMKKQERVSDTGTKNDEEKGTEKNREMNLRNTVCWYHTVFGERAVACVAPCQYTISPTPRP